MIEKAIFTHCRVRPGFVGVCPVVLGLLLGIFVARVAASQETTSTVQMRRGTITIPTYPWGPDDVNPHFVLTHGRPIYPYPMQDNLAREKVDRAYATMEIENEYLRVTVIPELGGHVHSVFDKSANRQMFYVNGVIKPGLIGLRGAWISGGIEFNTGPQGHTVTAVSPLSCRFVEHDDGSRSIAIGTIERVFRTQWVAVVTLRPGRSFLEERIRIYNPTPHVQPYYFWNCTAVPNTDGMRFMYPMTLGSDHSGRSFFRWPMDKGVDLSWSKNYRRPTSVFAYECDQDFFGSYDYDADHGVVAYANRFDLPGKKAWTWGRGDEGIRAQATLTDDGSLYNEVQTGPLVTQADYGLLQPHQTVEWKEWWYPVHGIGGYEFATRDVAVNVLKGSDADKSSLVVKVMGTGTWEEAQCRLIKDGREIMAKKIAVLPSRPTEVSVEGEAAASLRPPFQVEIAAGKGALASFTYPLPVPKREPPDLARLENPMKTARDHWAAGVLADKQSKSHEARKHLEKALELDPEFGPAHLDLAVLDLEAGLAEDARAHLDRVLERDSDNGRAHYYLGRALLEMGEEAAALEHAWRAARDSGSASIGMGLAGELYIRQHRWAEAGDVLQRAVAKDAQDIYNRNLLVIALVHCERRDEAAEQARRVLCDDPLDAFAALMLNDLKVKTDGASVGILERLRSEPQTALEVAAIGHRLKAPRFGLGVLRRTSLSPNGKGTAISYYYAAVFADMLGEKDEAKRFLERAAELSPDYVFPDRLETIAILQQAARLRPDDWRIHYYLGCNYLAHNRKEEAVAAWQKAVALGTEYSVVHRNLGIVAWKLEDDVTAAIRHFENTIARRSDDLTVCRDLATLYQKTERWTQARDLLEKALAFERYRSDVIELLARTYYHLGELRKASELIDARKFDAWEGQRSLYEMYRDVHMALGKQALEAGENGKAAAEFRRALEYPANLGVGRAESAREAEQYFWLGKALAAAGKRDEAKDAWRRAAEERAQHPSDFADQAAKMLKGDANE